MHFRTEKELENLLVSRDSTILEAIKIIDKGHFGIGIITDNQRVIKGILTDQDIRRIILQSVNLDEPVLKVMNTKPYTLFEEEVNADKILQIFKEKGFSQIPVINNQYQLVDLVFKSDLFNTDSPNEENKKKINSFVVIMAGGRGTRMEPFTTILPKPLIPIGNKSMLEVIMEEYARFGINSFTISVNYKANLIKAYLNDTEHNYSISYIQEDQPLGTAGSLKLLPKEVVKKPFFVSNCDIIIKTDYSKIYDFHLDGNYAITMVASLQHHQIPYGVCEIEKGGELLAIKEKPEFNFLVNTGMYIINPEILDEIPDNKFFHITHLMEKVKKSGKKVGVFPVSEKSWIDVGQWNEYRNALKMMNE